MLSAGCKNHTLLLNEGRPGHSLFIIPGIGGRCEGFRRLATYFAGECNVYGFHMVGTWLAEEPLSCIESIATQNLAWMKEIQPEGPYFIVGHSFGAFVAFEMAKQLSLEADGPVTVIILDQDAPLEPIFRPEYDPVRFVLQLTVDYCIDFKLFNAWDKEWGRRLRPALAGMDIRMHASYIENFLHGELKSKKRLINLVMRLVNLRVYNAFMEYYPTGKINGGLLLFLAADELEERGDVDPALGWSGHFDTMEVITVPGNHINLVFGENGSNISSAITPFFHLLRFPANCR
ncbi:MAG TPA: thioesterase domain-containing protein [Puia sp.]|jgi:thioesterase domain-containing protein|nr:thioesterase domain-containing protein [Puia sp.]